MKESPDSFAARDGILRFCFFCLLDLQPGHDINYPGWGTITPVHVGQVSHDLANSIISSRVWQTLYPHIGQPVSQLRRCETGKQVIRVQHPQGQTKPVVG
ncbi:MAG: hypothetical protein H7839_04780 [Magnetococcus sp. YQC-5]